MKEAIPPTPYTPWYGAEKHVKFNPLSCH